MSGCQKSGDAADFNDHLSLLNVKNHLVTFLHNRFNILLVDGGAVLYHRSHIVPKNEISGFSRSRHKGPVTSLEIIPKALHLIGYEVFH
jgi:hypothetical protein